MTKEKTEILYTLQSSSADELKTALPAGLASPKASARFVALALNDSRVHVCPFRLNDVEKKEIKDQLMLHAVELLSLPLDSIGLDYQVFESVEGRVRGIFTCFPKDVLREYLSALDEKGYVPIKIVPAIVASMDSFLQKNKGQKGRLCLIDFSKANVIYFAVFSNGHCDFLREVPYESAGEIEHEVLQSLRCACAASSVKKFDRIYFSGNVPNAVRLMEKIEKLFCGDVTQGSFTDVNTSLRATDNVLSLNLVKDRTFSIKQREVIAQATRAVLSLCCAMAIVLSVKIFTTELKIRDLRSSYQTADYPRAVELERRLKAK